MIRNFVIRNSVRQELCYLGTLLLKNFVIRNFVKNFVIRNFVTTQELCTCTQHSTIFFLVFIGPTETCLRGFVTAKAINLPLVEFFSITIHNSKHVTCVQAMARITGSIRCQRDSTDGGNSFWYVGRSSFVTNLRAIFNFQSEISVKHIFSAKISSKSFHKNGPFFMRLSFFVRNLRESQHLLIIVATIFVTIFTIFVNFWKKVSRKCEKNSAITKFSYNLTVCLPGRQ